MFVEKINMFTHNDSHYRNHKEGNIVDFVWSNRTTEAMKSRFSDKENYKGIAIIHTNEFNTVLNDLDRWNKFFVRFMIETKTQKEEQLHRKRMLLCLDWFNQNSSYPYWEEMMKKVFVMSPKMAFCTFEDIKELDENTHVLTWKAW